MELASRKGSDRFVPAGGYRRLEAELRRHEAELSEIPAVVLAAFDRRTRLLPFNLMDRWMFPGGARTVAGALWQAGFRRTRAVFQLWNPRFHIGHAELSGRKPQLFLISSMQLHSAKAYQAVRAARALGAERPLVIVGGPKAIFEPYHYWTSSEGNEPAAPDVAVTGEVYVLLELLNTLVTYRGRGETLRGAFDRARQEGALAGIPGLVYLAPGASPQRPALVDTGLQRLVQHLDELPDEVSGLSLLEPPHWGRRLSTRPLADHLVRRHSKVVALLVTQGCKFTCPYCPIPAMQQKSWRFRSPEGLAVQLRSVFERFGMSKFFGADDNFFNHRQTAADILTALANTPLSNGSLLGQCIRLYTEATQSDTYKNRDLLPLASRGGLGALWFGIEDLTATLVKKGQKPDKTIELFRLLREHHIYPNAMLMFHAGQPFYTRGRLYGLANQVEFLRRAGAMTVQCTAHFPALGSREMEATYASGKVLKQLGGRPIADRENDGNHVIVDTGEPLWLRQLQLLGGYAAFYNPLNLVRALCSRAPRRLRQRWIIYQLLGGIALFLTALRIIPYVVRLLLLKPRYHTAPPPARTVPVHHPEGACPRFPEGSALAQLGRSSERHAA